MTSDTESILQGIPCDYTKRAMAAISAIQNQCPALLKAGYKPEIIITGEGDEMSVDIILGPFRLWVIPESLKREEMLKENYFTFLHGPNKKAEPVSICDTSSIGVAVHNINTIYNYMKRWSKSLNPQTINV